MVELGRMRSKSFESSHFMLSRYGYEKGRKEKERKKEGLIQG